MKIGLVDEITMDSENDCIVIECHEDDEPKHVIFVQSTCSITVIGEHTIIIDDV